MLQRYSVRLRIYSWFMKYLPPQLAFAGIIVVFPVVMLVGANNHHVLLLFCAPCRPPMSPPGLLGSLGPSLLAFTLHHFGPSAWTFRFTKPTRVQPSPRSFGMNLLPDLHLATSTAMPHPTSVHQEPRDTTNPYDVVITHHLRVTTIGPQTYRSMIIWEMIRLSWRSPHPIHGMRTWWI